VDAVARRRHGGRDGGRQPLSESSLDIPVTYGTGISPPGVARNTNDYFWSANYAWDGGCWNSWGGGVPNTNIVMPLTSDKAALKDRLNSLTAYGPTAGPEATQWSWFMLSPKWSAIWPDSSLPAAYSDTVTTTTTGAPKVKKIAILMTDGVYNSYRSQISNSSWTNTPAQLSAYAQKVCQNMKNAGITIYTIGFGLNELPEADRELATTTLQQCSTNHQIQDGSWVYNFYDANSTSALKSAYTDIGQQLTKLRLTE
jgi:hypothetical protein